MSSPIDSNNPRVKEFFSYLLQMSAGNVGIQAPISSERDDLDAIIHAVNVLVGELAHAKSEAEKADKNKSDFITHISHEIRTPLAIILGYLESYDADLSPDKRLAMIERMKFSTEHTLRLVNQILDFARVNSEKLTIDSVDFDLRRELRMLIDGFRSEAHKKSIKIIETMQTGFKPDVSSAARGDLQKISQITMNLLSNAVKYSQSGEIRISISRQDFLQVKDGIFVRVEDTGIGVPIDKQALIFLPYRQANEREQGQMGLGIGLSISKRLCTLLGGDLFLESSSDKGSTFCFYLPITWKNDDISQNGSDPSSSDFLSGKKILLAEDNFDLRNLFNLYIADAGASVVMVENGEEALEAAKKQAFDLFLFDIRMPVMDGTTAIKELRSKGISTPAIALTAHAHTELIHTFIEIGFNDTVSKPFSREQLIACISKIFNNQ